MRRRELESSAANSALEAKVERLTRDLRNARPVANSRGRLDELAQRVIDLESSLAADGAALNEAKALQVKFPTIKYHHLLTPKNTEDVGEIN